MSPPTSRRGSNVSLVLDMSALGSVEPLNVAVVTPREAAAREYLLSAGRPLTHQQLRDIVNNTHKLHAEFAVSKPRRESREGSVRLPATAAPCWTSGRWRAEAFYTLSRM